jgi:hypothetical protein
MPSDREGAIPVHATDRPQEATEFSARSRAGRRQSNVSSSTTPTEMIRQLETLERGMSLTISWQEDSLERLRRVRASVGRLADALRDAQGIKVRSSGGQSQHTVETGSLRFALPPLLKCLFSVLERGSWCDVSFLSEAVFKAIGKRTTRRGLMQAIYRLRRELRVAGKTWRIESSRRLGWRMVKGGMKSTDT